MSHADTSLRRQPHSTLPDAWSSGSVRPPSFPAASNDLLLHGWRVGGELALGIELTFTGALDEDLLRAAAGLVLDAEPVLGCRLVTEAPAPYWERIPTSIERVFSVTRSEPDYERRRYGPMDATGGEQLAVCVWRRAGGDRLLIRITHEAGDGASLQYLAARIGAIYGALGADRSYRPAPNTATSRSLAQVLSLVPVREYPGVLWSFACALAPRVWPRRTHWLPLPSEPSGPLRTIARHLPPGEAAPLAAFARVRHATLNDMFLAAAYRAMASFGRWDGRSGLRIPITVNLRRWSAADDRPWAICNLSAFDCPFLGRRLGRTFEDTLANVSRIMAQRKKGRPGFPLAFMFHLATSVRGPRSALHQTGRTLDDETACRLTFSNEGALDNAGLRFGPQRPVSAHVLPPYFALPRLHLSLSGYAGALTLSAVTSANGQGPVEAFFDAVLQELPRQAPRDAKNTRQPAH